jgi:hypothetical protein
MRLKRTLQFLIVGLGIAIITIQFVGPAKSNPIGQASQSVEAHLHVPPEIATLIDRSCADCHSNKTRWPWYSHVAPVSWFVIDHVNHGRSHLNFSEWGRFTTRESGEMLQDICKEVKSGTMPLDSYTRIHTTAKLSGDDIKAICDWANSQRKPERIGAGPR